MEPSEFELTFGDTLSAALVVARGPPPTEIIPFRIPMGIVDRVMSNRNAGDGTVHPGYHFAIYERNMWFVLRLQVFL